VRQSTLFDVPTVRPALADRDGREARPLARRMKRGDIIYPRLMVLAGDWVRQDFEGGPFNVICGTEVARLCNIEAA